MTICLGRVRRFFFFFAFTLCWASLVAQTVNDVPAMQETWIWSLGLEDPLEEGMATHSSILAWRIPWTEEPDGLQSIGSQRVGRDWVTKHSTLSSPSLPDRYSPSGHRQIRVLASVTLWQVFVYLKWDMRKRKHKTDEWAKVWINNSCSCVTDGHRASATPQIDLQGFWKEIPASVFLKQKL